jgi:NADP-dependent 3-hydroxy acid dehydrogenase YdfG
MRVPLREQVIVLTGASAGIERPAALKLAEAGATLVLAARNEFALQQVANEIDVMSGRGAGSSHRR